MTVLIYRFSHLVAVFSETLLKLEIWSSGCRDSCRKHRRIFPPDLGRAVELDGLSHSAAHELGLNQALSRHLRGRPDRAVDRERLQPFGAISSAKRDC